MHRCTIISTATNESQGLKRNYSAGGQYQASSPEVFNTATAAAAVAAATTEVATAAATVATTTVATETAAAAVATATASTQECATVHGGTTNHDGTNRNARVV